MTRKSEGDYPIGYGKPPAHSQFQKGQSGNAKGRPKGSSRLSPLEKAMRRKITITVEGKRSRVEATEAVITKAMDQALKGDGPARRDILRLAAQLEAAKQKIEAAEAAQPPPAGPSRVLTFMSYSDRTNEILDICVLAPAHSNLGHKVRSWVVEAALARRDPATITTAFLDAIKDDLEDPSVLDPYYRAARGEEPTSTDQT